MPVERRDASPCVDKKQTNVGRLDCRLGLGAHPAFETLRRRFVEPGGIDKSELEIGERCVGLAPVASDTWPVAHQCQLPAYQAIEQRGFADVRPTDDNNLD